MTDAEIIQRAKQFTTWATCEPPPREESPYKPLNLKQPAEYRPLVSMTRSKP